MRSSAPTSDSSSTAIEDSQVIKDLIVRAKALQEPHRPRFHQILNPRIEDDIKGKYRRSIVHRAVHPHLITSTPCAGLVYRSSQTPDISSISNPEDSVEDHAVVVQQVEQNEILGNEKYIPVRGSLSKSSVRLSQREKIYREKIIKNSIIDEQRSEEHIARSSRCKKNENGVIYEEDVRPTSSKGSEQDVQIPGSRKGSAYLSQDESNNGKREGNSIHDEERPEKDIACSRRSKNTTNSFKIPINSPKDVQPPNDFEKETLTGKANNIATSVHLDHKLPRNKDRDSNSDEISRYYRKEVISSKSNLRSRSKYRSRKYLSPERNNSSDDSSAVCKDKANNNGLKKKNMKLAEMKNPKHLTKSKYRSVIENNRSSDTDLNERAAKNKNRIGEDSKYTKYYSTEKQFQKRNDSNSSTSQEDTDSEDEKLHRKRTKNIPIHKKNVPRHSKEYHLKMKTNRRSRRALHDEYDKERYSKKYRARSRRKRDYSRESCRSQRKISLSSSSNSQADRYCEKKFTNQNMRMSRAAKHRFKQNNCSNITSDFEDSLQKNCGTHGTNKKINAEEKSGVAEYGNNKIRNYFDAIDNLTPRTATVTEAVLAVELLRKLRSQGGKKTLSDLREPTISTVDSIPLGNFMRNTNHVRHITRDIPQDNLKFKELFNGTSESSLLTNIQFNDRNNSDNSGKDINFRSSCQSIPNTAHESQVRTIQQIARQPFTQMIEIDSDHSNVSSAHDLDFMFISNRRKRQTKEGSIQNRYHRLNRIADTLLKVSCATAKAKMSVGFQTRKNTIPASEDASFQVQFSQKKLQYGRRRGETSLERVVKKAKLDEILGVPSEIKSASVLRKKSRSKKTLELQNTEGQSSACELDKTEKISLLDKVDVLSSAKTNKKIIYQNVGTQSSPFVENMESPREIEKMSRSKVIHNGHEEEFEIKLANEDVLKKANESKTRIAEMQNNGYDVEGMKILKEHALIEVRAPSGKINKSVNSDLNQTRKNDSKEFHDVVIFGNKEISSAASSRKRKVERSESGMKEDRVQNDLDNSEMFDLVQEHASLIVGDESPVEKARTSYNSQQSAQIIPQELVEVVLDVIEDRNSMKQVVKGDSLRRIESREEKNQLQLQGDNVEIMDILTEQAPPEKVEEDQENEICFSIASNISESIKKNKRRQKRLLARTKLEFDRENEIAETDSPKSKKVSHIISELKNSPNDVGIRDHSAQTLKADESFGLQSAIARDAIVVLQNVTVKKPRTRSSVRSQAIIESSASTKKKKPQIDPLSFKEPNIYAEKLETRSSFRSRDHLDESSKVDKENASKKGESQINPHSFGEHNITAEKSRIRSSFRSRDNLDESSKVVEKNVTKKAELQIGPHSFKEHNITAEKPKLRGSFRSRDHLNESSQDEKNPSKKAEIQIGPHSFKEQNITIEKPETGSSVRSKDNFHQPSEVDEEKSTEKAELKVGPHSHSAQTTAKDLNQEVSGTGRRKYQRKQVEQEKSSKKSKSKSKTKTKKASKAIHSNSSEQGYIEPTEGIRKSTRQRKPPPICFWKNNLTERDYKIYGHVIQPSFVDERKHSPTRKIGSRTKAQGGQKIKESKVTSETKNENTTTENGLGKGTKDVQQNASTEPGNKSLSGVSERNLNKQQIIEHEPPGCSNNQLHSQPFEIVNKSLQITDTSLRSATKRGLTDLEDPGYLTSDINFDKDQLFDENRAKINVEKVDVNLCEKIWNEIAEKKERLRLRTMAIDIPQCLDVGELLNDKKHYGFFMMKPTEKKRGVNRNYTVFYHICQGMCSLRLGHKYFEETHRNFHIPQGTPYEIQNIGSEPVEILWINLTC